jgi:penicillin amidase
MSYASAVRFRLLASVLSLLLLVLILAAGGLWWLTRRSLPEIDGTAALPGLAAAVVVDRDGAGVPTIRGATRADVARGLGYVHAQDRFFQMDLLRRRSAGELAEIFGKEAVPVDREARIHGFRALARQALVLLPPEQKTLIDAYTAGVNAGLAALRARPFEYYVLRVRPQPWQAEDTLLVGYAMVLDLQDSRDRYEQMLSAIQFSYGRTLLDFLAPTQTEPDAALDGSTSPQPAVPGPEIIDLRKHSTGTGTAIRLASRLASSQSRWEGFGSGSNAFALAGGRTANGSALLANDMHLHLGVPNVWYRASLLWTEESPNSESQTPNPETKPQIPKPNFQSQNLGPQTQNPKPKTQNPEPKTPLPAPARGARRETCRVTGVTLPGLPVVIAGSNGRIAWGFTNSNADTADIVIVESSSIDSLLYMNGVELPQMEQRKETIRVKGHDPVEFTALWTIWGPVISEPGGGRFLAMHWVFHDPAALNLNSLALETAPDAATALELAPDFGLPAQNIVVADRSGAIGWTVAGRIPRRVGFDGRLPAVWGYGDRKWNGCLPSAEYPRILSPPSGQLWSANNRPLGGLAFARLGDGGYDSGARAQQIRDDLTAITAPATPRDLLSVQLDDRALLLDRWQKLLLSTLTPDAVGANPARTELRRLVAQWNGRASIDSVAYNLVRQWRESVAGRVLGPVCEPCLSLDASFDFHRLNYEAPLWQLIQQRPPNFLTPDYLAWDDLLLKAADDVLQWADSQGRSLSHLTWGARNTARIQHPFSRFLPAFLSRLIDMPAVPLPGDDDMPRVQGPRFGASERFVVSPGHEEEGVFHMPGGQSGNPLSPFYRDGYEAWARGDPTPFLPGPARHTLRLEPRADRIAAPESR